MTDKGSEFVNSTMKSYFKSIRFYTTESPDIKAGVAERVIRTIKAKLYRYFTKTGSYRYIDVIATIMMTYNNTHHRSIGMSPAQVNRFNENQVRNRLYPFPKQLKKPKLVVGDNVRILLKK